MGEINFCKIYNYKLYLTIGCTWLFIVVKYNNEGGKGAVSITFHRK